MNDFSGQPASPDSTRTDEAAAASAPAPPLADLASIPPPPLPEIPASPLPASTPKSQAVRTAAPRPSSRPGIRLPKPKSSAAKPSLEPAADAEVEIPSWLANSTAGQIDVASSQPAAKALKPESIAVNPLADELAAIEETAIRAGITAAGAVEAELLSARQREAGPAAEQMRREQSTEAIVASEPKLAGLRDVLFALGLNNPNRSRESVTLPELPPIHPQPTSQSLAPESTETALPAVEHQTPAETARVVVAPPALPAPQADSTRKDRRDRRDAYDEVEILPSWRGQYKRKD